MITLLPPELLRAARAMTGLSQAEVAVLADVSQKTLSQMEAGKVTSAVLVEKLRKFYESQDIEFIASRDSGRASDGIGVRRRPERPDVGVRII